MEAKEASPKDGSFEHLAELLAPVYEEPEHIGSCGHEVQNEGDVCTSCAWWLGK